MSLCSGDGFHTKNITTRKITSTNRMQKHSEFLKRSFNLFKIAHLILLYYYLLLHIEFDN